MKLVVIPGDGIGPETMAATVGVLQAASQRFDLNLQIEHEIAGHESLRQHGATVTPTLLEKVKNADGLMLGPMATYDFKDEAKGEINPSKFFRKELDLFANIRPARTYEGLTPRLGTFDLVVVRENTEGFYADRNIASGGSEMLITPDVAVSLRRITRECCERIARSAFELAMTRQRKVTIVHKANVLKIGDGMFIEECLKVAREFPQVEVNDIIVDAMMAHVVRAPQRFDVVVTTNMFGDILSDLTAELSGSLGLGGSLNAGSQYAMGQAAHGSAPDIAGKNIANPFSQVLSAVQLLDWYGRKAKRPEFETAAAAIGHAVEAVIRQGQVTVDLGGALGTAETGQAVVQQLLQT
ncbi:isocitrate/isopropylmalate dehydrogenase family protein [Lampropedia puyangensis]|uniref:Isocitrate/isopropylmalate dehydrogenase family protein n=1 Tax=Lampropedia puyangensis TaxID=1330072 RepID=A0A4S8F7Y8_9BURK|nr:isocitrate/isopropylmalate family dehydrogenase [Lampropedia puyangensis]THU03723.1 isocitrate/isopropylmalate dehydrogenase family protein [Lampropedia puyangensis]